MEKSKTKQPVQDKTKKESNQKTNEDFNKKEINPNYATSKKDYPEVKTQPNQNNYDLESISVKNKVKTKDSLKPKSK